jgi:hypothetical protein
VENALYFFLQKFTTKKVPIKKHQLLFEEKTFDE